MNDDTSHRVNIRRSGSDRGGMLERIGARLGARPGLWRALPLVVGLVVAACTNSGGRPGY